ncbi:hypothetical protein [Dapis sp. BLCC M172]|uniref:hypothetical protein n=1 Tax=Dapis sp. BLCC M172 TaxID=2975281 RepID=UPI003CF6F757
MLPPGADVTFCAFTSLVKEANINARAVQLTNIGFVILLVIFIFIRPLSYRIIIN